MLLGYNYSQSYSLREAISCVYVFLVMKCCSLLVDDDVLIVGEVGPCHLDHIRVRKQASNVQLVLSLVSLSLLKQFGNVALLSGLMNTLIDCTELTPAVEEVT